MPRQCSVAGCRSNYDSKEKYVTIFAIPKTEPLRTQWLRKIPTDFSKLKNPGVCLKHFEESSIIRTDTVTVNGELRVFPRKIPKLKPGTLPTLFPNLPSYLSSATKSCRRLADVEQENLDAAIKQSLMDHKQHMEKTTFQGIDDILSYLNTDNTELRDKWIVLAQDQKLRLCFYKISDDCPVLLACVVIKQLLDCDVYINKVKIPKNRLPKKVAKINNTSTLDELMIYVEQHATDPNSEVTVDGLISALESTATYTESDQIKFIVEQLKLCKIPKKQRRYCNKTLVLAASLYVHSTSAYNALLKCGYLYFPQIRTLQTVISNYSLSGNTLLGSIRCLKSKIMHLKQHELLVNLLMDEVYIEPQMNFKGGSLYGSSDSGSKNLARTAQVFMISSTVSSYSDVVSIVPVCNLSADNLRSMLLSVLTEVEKIGFKVISVISDNNTVNRKAFELLSVNKILQPYIPYPSDHSRLLFLIFDIVHIIKCIRNNWINKKDAVLTFPEIETGSIMCKARYKHLELYDMERNSLLKYGHSLSNKVLYPSNIQKQNVKLALKVINENNIAALKCVSRKHPDIFVGVEDTCAFLDVFVKWWKIVNVKSVFEGQRFNDAYREPVRNKGNVQVDFLQKMSVWLKKWRQSVPLTDSLTSQTFQSLINTNDAFIKLIPYMFQNYQLDYLLLGKFLTDNLESRFGLYRQMSGGNYFISYVQLLESERKLRFKSNVIFHSKNVNVPLKSMIPYEEQCHSKCAHVKFLNVLPDEICLSMVPTNILPILVYIAGYAARKELRSSNCSFCESWLQLDRTVDVLDSSYDFITELDRGKLVLPSEPVVTSVAVVWYIFQQIIEHHHDDFIKCEGQLSVLQKLSYIQFNRQNLSVNDTCDCRLTLHARLENICLLISKIMLNNYTKYRNDCLSRTKSNQRKIRKLCPI